VPYLNGEELIVSERGMYAAMSENSAPQVVVKEKDTRGFEN